MLSSKTATAVFDFYESVIEADILNLTGIQVSLIKAGGLRLSLNVCCKADLSALVSGDNIRCEKRMTRNTSTLYLKRKKVTGNECIFFSFSEFWQTMLPFIMLVEIVLRSGCLCISFFAAISLCAAC